MTASQGAGRDPAKDETVNWEAQDRAEKMRLAALVLAMHPRMEHPFTAYCVCERYWPCPTVALIKLMGLGPVEQGKAGT